jgi:hypothetical protein
MPREKIMIEKLVILFVQTLDLSIHKKFKKLHIASVNAVLCSDFNSLQMHIQALKKSTQTGKYIFVLAHVKKIINVRPTLLLIHYHSNIFVWLAKQLIKALFETSAFQIRFT